jgi:hypothetical protein
VITGMVANHNRSFSMVVETEKALSSLADAQLNTLEGFAEELGARLNHACATAKNDGRLRSYPVSLHPDEKEQGTMASVWLAGYFRKGKPAVILTLLHDNQILTDPELVIETPPARGGTDPKFTNYFLHVDRHSPLDDAIAFAVGYIKACSDPSAVQLDPFCKYVGGRTHAATITPSGFHWVQGLSQ